MKNIKHITPRYVLDRTRYALYAHRNPEKPWLTPMANVLLSELLTDRDKIIEFGSGRSTIWFAEKVAEVVSIEHDSLWFDKVQEKINLAGCTNVNHHLCKLDVADKLPGSYLSVLREFGPGSIDMILVDGEQRAECALEAVEVVKSGGFIVVDNCNWFLPSNSHSPVSRSFNEGPVNYVWAKYLEATSKWRSIWTSSGYTDTCFYFKP